MIFRFYTIYNNHVMIEIGIQTSGKPQVLSQVLE